MSNGQREIKLKFMLTAEAARPIRAQAFAHGRRDDLVSTYFDTPGLDIQAATATLRLRKATAGWVQTVKAAGANTVSRFEDERLAPRGRLNAKLFPKMVLKRLGGVDPDDLRPLFETHVKRHIQMALRNGSSVEMALDEGEIGYATPASVAGERPSASWSLS